LPTQKGARGIGGKKPSERERVEAKFAEHWQKEMIFMNGRIIKHWLVANARASEWMRRALAAEKLLERVMNQVESGSGTAPGGGMQSASSMSPIDAELKREVTSCLGVLGEGENNTANKNNANKNNANNTAETRKQQLQEQGKQKIQRQLQQRMQQQCTDGAADLARPIGAHEISPGKLLQKGRRFVTGFPKRRFTDRETLVEVIKTSNNTKCNRKNQ
jgi:hypothetical protein